MMHKNEFEKGSKDHNKKYEMSSQLEPVTNSYVTTYNALAYN